MEKNNQLKRRRILKQKINLKKVEQHKHAEEEEKETVQEMLDDLKNHFNHDYNSYTNQQLIGYKYLFRGVIVKEWEVSNQKCIDFKLHNNAIVKMQVEYFYECWKRR